MATGTDHELRITTLEQKLAEQAELHVVREAAQGATKTMIQGLGTTQSDHTRSLRKVRETQAEHTRTLAEHTRDIRKVQATQAEHTATLAEHGRDIGLIKDTLVEHTDTLAEHGRDIGLIKDTLVEHTDTLAEHGRDIGLIKDTLVEHTDTLAEHTVALQNLGSELAGFRTDVTKAITDLNTYHVAQADTFGRMVALMERQAMTAEKHTDVTVEQQEILHRHSIALDLLVEVTDDPDESSE